MCVLPRWEFSACASILLQKFSTIQSALPIYPDRKSATFVLCEPDESFQISRRDRDVFSNLAHPGISRRAKNPVRMRRLPQLPCKSVFAAAAANDENSHKQGSVTVTVAREIASQRLALLLCS